MSAPVEVVTRAFDHHLYEADHHSVMIATIAGQYLAVPHESSPLSQDLVGGGPDPLSALEGLLSRCGCLAPADPQPPVGEQGATQLCCTLAPPNLPNIGPCTEPAGHVARYATWHAHLDRAKTMETRWPYTPSERPD